MSIVNNIEFSLEAQGRTGLLCGDHHGCQLLGRHLPQRSRLRIWRLDIVKLNPAVAQTIELDKTEELIRLRTDTIRAVEVVFTQEY